MSVFAILPAAGTGSRMASAIPKQFLKFNGKELIVYSLEVFQNNPNIKSIAVAASKEYIPLVKRLQKKYSLTKLTNIVEGGKERQDSVLNALASLPLQSKDLAAVHDAARPLLTQKILNSAIKLALLKSSAVVCVEGRDTLIRFPYKEEIESSYKNPSDSIEYIDRKDVYYVQTPQIFNASLLLSCVRRASLNGMTFPDESSLMKHYGFSVHLSEGSLLNFKVTIKSDLEVIKQIIG